MEYEIEIIEAGAMTGFLPDLIQYTDGWLDNRRLSEHTREAYRRDIHQWLMWCAERGHNPLQVTFIHVNTYGRMLEAQGLAPASAHRKLMAVSSWYRFLESIGKVPRNPVTRADKPHVDRDHSSTVGLSPAETDMVLLAAQDSLRDTALLMVYADLGLRVSEPLAANVGALSVRSGRPVFTYIGKGSKRRTRSLSDDAYAALRAYLDSRGNPDPSEPLFLGSKGSRLDRHAVFRLVRKYAQAAGLESWADISPHSLRHSFATAAKDEGVPLEDVQDAMGHADPRTTRRYDRNRYKLDNDPALKLAAARKRRATVQHTDSE